MKSRAPGVLNNDSKTQKRSLFYLMNFFTEHPESVGETYFEHFFVAIRFSCKLFLSSIAALIWANDLSKVIINIKFYRFDNLNYFLSYQLTVTSQ